MKRWEDHWELVANESDSKSGGQGKVRKVRKINSPHDIGALKEMHPLQQENSSRRRRIRREVLAIKKMNGNGVPRILDENMEDIDSSIEGTKVPIYFVTEWVEGSDLHTHYQKSKPDIETSLRLIRDLAITTGNCHLEGVIHRDIKPQNVMVMQGENIYRPILIDFGIAWVEPPIDQQKKRNLTARGEELGNRFLKLPELQAGVSDKRNEVSDVTFLVGLLFFLITGEAPRQLLDENELLPHERPGLISDKLQEDGRWPILRTIFTIGFSYSIKLRFKNTSLLVAYIDKILNPMADPLRENGELDESLAELKALMSKDYIQVKRQLFKEYERINKYILGQFILKIGDPKLGIGVGSGNRRNDEMRAIRIVTSVEGAGNIKIPEVYHEIKIIEGETTASYKIENDQIDYYSGPSRDILSLEEAVSEYLPEVITNHTKLIISKIQHI